MEFKLTEREQDALRKLASLGNLYQPLHNEATSLLAVGLVETDGNGGVRLTADGRKYLRDFDIVQARN
ncbi:hypothetical protein HUX88_29295 [Duganella sp. BJB1802]|uniref:hypothetical protein n=1 Tax=unclassified Duganella TaxID=2636909 RepID=UPI0011C14BB2|nr:MULTISPECIES: hypothetical protein [unclassified Duganella]NVD74585.1 hypothetical protein [Duganella sp. BJB1802]